MQAIRTIQYLFGVAGIKIGLTKISNKPLKQAAKIN